MENLKLYQITDGFLELMNNFDELNDVEAIQEELKKALLEKSNNIIGYYLDRKALIGAIDEQIKRLQEYKKAESNKLDRYKDYVKTNMEAMGITNIETSAGKISVAKSPISVDIIDENLVPEEFKNTEVVIKVDKKKIADVSIFVIPIASMFVLT